MDRAIRHFETYVIGAVLALMAVVLVLSVIELAWVLWKDVSSPPILILDIDELLELFGLFLLVIIGVELFEAVVKTYLHERVDRAEVVVIVAIIAVARKVIVIDVTETDPLVAAGIGVLVLGLAIGYFLIKFSRIQELRSDDTGRAGHAVIPPDVREPPLPRRDVADQG